MVKRREMEEPKVEIIPARKKAKKVCVGIYARVSTERKAQLTSLAAQISGLTRYCYRRQYPLKDIYIDVTTGKKTREGRALRGLSETVSAVRSIL